MKKQIIVFAFLMLSAGLNAQTKDQKNNISLGGGKECYNGDLGNSWFSPGEEWYGFVHASYSRYLNPSFDMLAFGTVGDIGRCRADDSPVNTLNLYARMSSGVVCLKYKFANGYLFGEDSKIAPYIFFGAGISNMTDIWNHKDVNPGTYYSINAGGGFKYNFCKRYSIGYTIGFGYFTSDGLDYIVKSKGPNDAYMQHTFSAGFNF